MIRNLRPFAAPRTFSEQVLSAWCTRNSPSKWPCTDTSWRLPGRPWSMGHRCTISTLLPPLVAENTLLSTWAKDYVFVDAYRVRPREVLAGRLRALAALDLALADGERDSERLRVEKGRGFLTVLMSTSV